LVLSTEQVEDGTEHKSQGSRTEYSLMIGDDMAADTEAVGSGCNNLAAHEGRSSPHVRFCGAAVVQHLCRDQDSGTHGRAQVIVTTDRDDGSA
jgi:hypothetical protein